MDQPTHCCDDEKVYKAEMNNSMKGGQNQTSIKILH